MARDLSASMARSSRIRPSPTPAVTRLAITAWLLASITLIGSKQCFLNKSAAIWKCEPCFGADIHGEAAMSFQEALRAPVGQVPGATIRYCSSLRRIQRPVAKRNPGFEFSAADTRNNTARIAIVHLDREHGMAPHHQVHDIAEPQQRAVGHGRRHNGDFDATR